MTNTVYTKTYDAPIVEMREIMRYAGVRGEAAEPELEKLIRGCYFEVFDKLTYKVCYTELDVTFGDGTITVGNITIRSAALAKNLAGCTRAVLFAATVGVGIDRLIARYGTVSPTRALMMQAIGTERIESLCDIFCRDISEGYAAMGCKVRPRFSPGYGDLPITLQREIFALLDCPRRIGLSLNESMLMSPSKSVTAIIGISKNGTE